MILQVIQLQLAIPHQFRSLLLTILIKGKETPVCAVSFNSSEICETLLSATPRYDFAATTFVRFSMMTSRAPGIITFLYSVARSFDSSYPPEFL